MNLVLAFSYSCVYWHRRFNIRLVLQKQSKEKISGSSSSSLLSPLRFQQNSNAKFFCLVCVCLFVPFFFCRLLLSWFVSSVGFLFVCLEERHTTFHIPSQQLVDNNTISLFFYSCLVHQSKNVFFIFTHVFFDFLFLYVMRYVSFPLSLFAQLPQHVSPWTNRAGYRVIFLSLSLHRSYIKSTNEGVGHKNNPCQM